MRVINMSAAAVRSIALEAQASRIGIETGGILLGHDDGATMTVTVAGGPGTEALRAARRFKRDQAHAQRLADDTYEVDGSVWIGEWHTHPRGPVDPSDVDLNTYFSHIADESLGFERFLSLIVLPCSKHGWEHVTIVAWVVDRAAVELAEVRTEEGFHD